MDEVHFQQYGSRCRMWIPPEVKDPVLQHHPTRKSVGYFGAVRLRDGKFIFARELNQFDAMTTWNFLRLLQRRSLKSRRRVCRHNRQREIPPGQTCQRHPGLGGPEARRRCRSRKEYLVGPPAVQYSAQVLSDSPL